MALDLLIIDGVFAICKLDCDTPMPSWATSGKFLSITRTDDELSIVCANDVVPENVECERDWRCLRVAGKMPFAIVGVMASLTVPLADAGISVFAVSTFDTDYLLVKDAEFALAIASLRNAGHLVSVA